MQKSCSHHIVASYAKSTALLVKKAPCWTKRGVYYLQQLIGVKAPLPCLENFSKSGITEAEFFSGKNHGAGQGYPIRVRYTNQSGVNT